jgi:methylthioxylose transferase
MALALRDRTPDVEPAPALGGGAHRRSAGAHRRSAGERPAVVAWCAVVAAALAWGTVAVRTRDVGLHAAPFKGHWTWHGGWRLLPALGLGLAVARWGPHAARRLSWRWMLLATGSTAAVWTVALAAGDGLDRIAMPLTRSFEYEPFAAGIDDLGGFLATYVDRLPGYPVHVQGHPPGPVVLAWALDRAGLSGAGWLAAVAIAAWGVAVAAALVTARAVAGDRAARRAAPALVLLPAALWAGTSVDPVFAALGAVAVALATRAATPGAEPRRASRGRRRAALSVGGGLLFGTALLFTYGAAALAPVLVGATVAARLTAGDRLPIGTLVMVGLGATGALGGAALAGFWWPEGLAATGRQYWAGVGGHRPGVYLTLTGNPAVLAVALGPLVAVGLGTLAHHARWAMQPARGRARCAMVRTAAPGDPAIALALIVGAALAAVALADLSQMARGEVERIWLLFVPWLALAAPGDRRGWLAAQVALAVALQSTLLSPW